MDTSHAAGTNPGRGPLPDIAVDGIERQVDLADAVRPTAPSRRGRPR
jgi:hypothetical protein